MTCLQINFRKIWGLYEAHKKSIPKMINRNNRITNERLEKLSEAVNAKVNTMKQLTNRTSDLEKGLKLIRI